MKEYKLHRTDGKTFFEFRSNPESRCEGFTISYLDDGTVVMSGDYGTLCWKRNYRSEDSKREFNYDYGFPNKETGISYFAEKVCQWGIKQTIEVFDADKAKEQILKEILSDIGVKIQDYDNFYGLPWSKIDSASDNEKIMDWLYNNFDFENEYEMYDKLSEFDSEFSTDYSSEFNYGTEYSDEFKFRFNILQSVSEQILDAVNNTNKYLNN